MPVTDLTIGVATIVSIVTASIAVTAMFVMVRERVRDHEDRLQYHSRQIEEIKRVDGETQKQLATIMAQLAHLTKLIEELRGGPR